MKFLRFLPLFFIIFGNLPNKSLVHAEVKNPENYKVLSTNSKSLSIAYVKYYLKSVFNKFD